MPKKQKTLDTQGFLVWVRGFEPPLPSIRNSRLPHCRLQASFAHWAGAFASSATGSAQARPLSPRRGSAIPVARPLLPQFKKKTDAIRIASVLVWSG